MYNKLSVVGNSPVSGGGLEIIRQSGKGMAWGFGKVAGSSGVTDSLWLNGAADVCQSTAATFAPP